MSKYLPADCRCGCGHSGACHQGRGCVCGRGSITIDEPDWWTDADMDGPADHSIADEMLEELRQENQRLRDAIGSGINWANGAFWSTHTTEASALRMVVRVLESVLNPTEVDDG